MRIRNDRYNTSRPELTLIRTGQHLWAMYKRSCGISENVSERQALWEALQDVWNRKKELRAELRMQRAGRAALLRERFRPVACNDYAMLPPQNCRNNTKRLERKSGLPTALLLNGDRSRAFLQFNALTSGNCS